LGVGKSCADNAVYGELGEMPLYTDIALHMTKYWHRLHSVDDNSLLHDAYLCDYNLYDRGKDSMNLVIHKTFQQLQLNHLFNSAQTIRATTFGKIIKKRISEKYVASWKNNLLDDHGKNGKGGNKLRTYRKFKIDFGLERYLSNINNREDRRRLSQLRTSSHKLCIETGRHLKIPESDRLCPMCPQGLIESEIHFTMQCSAYTDLRNNLFKNINNKNFTGLSYENKFIWLMLNEDCIINTSFAKFVSGAFDIRLATISDNIDT